MKLRIKKEWIEKGINGWYGMKNGCHILIGIYSTTKQYYFQVNHNKKDFHYNSLSDRKMYDTLEACTNAALVLAKEV